jgi:filamentous hemagglutinin family protein
MSEPGPFEQKLGKLEQIIICWLVQLPTSHPKRLSIGCSMLSPIQRYGTIALIGAINGLVVPIAQAQVTPDATLATTVSSPNNLNFTISDGSRSGANLFHSFSNFSVPTGGSAMFNNAADVQTIFSRVTGSSLSTIDGLIKANGSANLFLLNPNGIVFGPNAKLDLGSAFLATTADQLNFADGTSFSASNPAPMLTMSVPIGVQFGNQAADISVQSTPGLSVKPGQSLTLLGGTLNLDKGRLTTVDGRIQLGSVGANSAVGLTPSGVDYREVSQFGDINLTNAAKIDVSGPQGGAIGLTGRNITLSGAANVLAHTQGPGVGQGIQVKASESLTLRGVPSIAVTMIAAYSQATATGRGGEVTIVTPTIQVLNGAQIRTRAYGRGEAGNITAQATTIDVIGEALNPADASLRFNPSSIASNTENGSKGNGGQVNITATDVHIRDGGELRATARGAGNGGNIWVTAQRLSVTGESATGDPGLLTGMSTSIREEATGQGGSITLNVGQLAVLNGPAIRTGSYGDGRSGSITVNADSATLSGNSSNGVATRFFASTYGTYDDDDNLIRLGNGQGGNIIFNVNTLNLLNGGRLSTSTETYGKAGNIQVKAQSIGLSGASQAANLNYTYALDATGPSGLYAYSIGPGDAGSVQINTAQLSLRDRAEIAVSASKTGNAGNLVIHADQVKLDQSAKLRADVVQGSQGNIHIDANVLLLRRGSMIQTNAGTNANGGNITLNTPTLVGWENSDIEANAIKGQGGNIQITTQGIFGLKFRPQLTAENDITASSEFGVNGTVEVNTIGVDPNSGLMTLPVDIVDPSQHIAAGCNPNQGSSFAITGRGGTPDNPTQRLIADRPWQDLRHRTTTAIVSTNNPTVPSLTEATTWQLNAQQQPELIADGLRPTAGHRPTPRPAISATCAP